MVVGCCECAYSQGWEDHDFLALAHSSFHIFSDTFNIWKLRRHAQLTRRWAISLWTWAIHNMFLFSISCYALFCMNLWKFEHFLTSEFVPVFNVLFFYVETLKHFCNCPFLYIIVSQQVDGLLCVGPQILVPIMHTVFVNNLYGFKLLLLCAFKV
jgi:hypothetical protein